jgi:hypothetical protein
LGIKNWQTFAGLWADALLCNKKKLANICRFVGGRIIVQQEKIGKYLQVCRRTHYCATRKN